MHCGEPGTMSCFARDHTRPDLEGRLVRISGGPFTGARPASSGRNRQTSPSPVSWLSAKAARLGEKPGDPRYPISSGDRRVESRLALFVPRGRYRARNSQAGNRPGMISLPFTSFSIPAPSMLGRVSPRLSGRIAALSGGPGGRLAPVTGDAHPGCTDLRRREDTAAAGPAHDGSGARADRAQSREATKPH
jgi:hypothetical protein